MSLRTKFRNEIDRIKGLGGTHVGVSEKDIRCLWSILSRVEVILMEVENCYDDRDGPHCLHCELAVERALKIVNEEWI